MSQDLYIHSALPGAVWRASSYSGGQGNCVEVAGNLPGVVPVRDSKRSGRPAIAFSPRAWGAFVGHLR
ncbi:DUF397 domain-containing protein [Streptomyces sp. ID05-04B]|uniref:DUF397 domain-containing protein n=1 Tax=unclassified Streptomyces TaxID=2593676 RepID=UPI000D1AA3E8|nr:MULTISPECIES: DUF397 domain-containing protein [unclassified Streptomyces]AVV41300.1 DUF397 domain-containing protein [Streptomyces sp. P3]MDX5567118.1 DUF397 domain-containing protein [Streptomyces sp. ID05-04B]